MHFGISAYELFIKFLSIIIIILFSIVCYIISTMSYVKFITQFDKIWIYICIFMIYFGFTILHNRINIINHFYRYFNWVIVDYCWTIITFIINYNSFVCVASLYPSSFLTFKIPLSVLPFLGPSHPSAAWSSLLQVFNALV